MAPHYIKKATTIRHFFPHLCHETLPDACCLRSPLKISAEFTTVNTLRHWATDTTRNEAARPFCNAGTPFSSSGNALNIILKPRAHRGSFAINPSTTIPFKSQTCWLASIRCMRLSCISVDNDPITNLQNLLVGCRTKGVTIVCLRAATASRSTTLGWDGSYTNSFICASNGFVPSTMAGRNMSITHREIMASGAAPASISTRRLCTVCAPVTTASSAKTTNLPVRMGPSAG
mmetsp:Transcript_12015/g.26604  ORF Transcript_12015/g.26604 Transcript_12015/m.26604 type:complete len:232 (-) Transcript_12015:868-1563(-)